MTDLFNPSTSPSAPVSVDAVSPSVDILTFSAGPFQTNCYVLINRSVAAGTPAGSSITDAATGSSASASTPGHNTSAPVPAVVIDPGLGAFDTVTSLGRELNFHVEKVVLTHGHIDHIRDAADFNVPVYVHPLDRPFLEMDQSASPFAQIFDVATMKPVADLRELTEDSIDIAGVQFDIHHMPGHSPGHVMFRVPGFIIGGDVLFRGGVGRTDLPGSSPEDMVLSLKKLTHEFDDNDVVVTGHGQATTIGEEKRTNGYLQAVR
ncbi:MBL fold metallo-hydrolase [Corynebacterium auriscanis]|uniref:MBL fold metallo-hydrolase n=1 Tax=Corynebacterium auriscanis TaxID=99807 RepID=UPI003CED9BC6